MSLVPIRRLKKIDIIWLAEHKCKHRHTYLDHYSCFLKDNPSDSPLYERIGFLDIESGLQGDYDYAFSYCIKKAGGEIIESVATSREIKSFKFDYPLMKRFCRDIRQFDRVIVYYGKDYRHDIPFLRTRCLTYELDFPSYKELRITDVYDIIRKKFKLHRNRLQTACEQFNIPCKAHPIIPKIWQRAKAGCPESLAYILQHNREDVVSLELLWNKVREFIRLTDTSI